MEAIVSTATDTDQRVVGRSAPKRQAILHAARDLFLQKGYAGASMDEVAAVAGVSKVTIYKHFSDKHTLFVAVVTDAIEEAKAGSHSLVDQLGTSKLDFYVTMNVDMTVQQETDHRRVDLKVDLRFEANYGEIKEVKIPTSDLVVGHNLIRVLMSTWDGKDIIEEVPVEVPASLAGGIVQLEVSAGDSAKLDAPPPVDLPSLLNAFRSLLPGDVWAVTLYPADEGVALDGKLVRDLPQSALDKLHPQSHTQRAALYKPISRTKSPAKRVVNGTSSTLVHIRAR